MQKNHETIGCCGIDCGLCPRFYTDGSSACPGCGGPNFKEKHPACGCLTCCAVKNGFEVCSKCSSYPCERITSEKSRYDSFVTHRRMLPNLDFIKDNGIDLFIDQQKVRMAILADFLNDYDDGRSKSFLCLSCALLPIDKLQEALRTVKESSETTDLKAKNKQLRDALTTIAVAEGVELKLNKRANR